MSTVLIAGGLGYIGSTLVDYLLKKKFKIIIVDINVYKLKFIEHKNLCIYYEDIRNKKAISKIFQDNPKISYVINLAAIVGDKQCDSIPLSSKEINIKGNKILANISKKFGVKRYIFASTCSIYGVNEKIVSEKSKLNPVSLYSETKILSEKYLLKLNSKRFNCIILRFGTAFGISFRTRFDLLVNSLSYEAYTKNKITVFSTKIWRPYIHVKDISKLILVSLHKIDYRKFPVFNAGFNKNNKDKEYLIKLLNKKINSLNVKKNNLEDIRSYHVNFNKIECFQKKINFISINKGINEIGYFIKTTKNHNYIFKKHSLNNNVKFLKKYFGN